MKHTYTDEQIQAAIDAAFREATSLVKLSASYGSSAWEDEKADRLDVAKILLARLPEPTPPTPDGKTPGQVLHEASKEHDEKKNGVFGWKAWDKIDCQDLYEVGASAVLAAFGGAGLEQAIARMEAVPWEELRHLCFENNFRSNDYNTIRARLIAAAREGDGHAAVDWKACHKKAEVELADAHSHLDQLGFLRGNGEDEFTLKGRLATLPGFQPQLSTLRPITEAGDVPAGCVRWFTKHGPAAEIIANTGGPDTHFADILLPEDKAPAVEAVKPVETFEAHGKTWNVHVPGDPIPCDGKIKIDILDRSGCVYCDQPAHHHDSDFWTAEYWNPIIGWRYADEPAPPEPVKPWTPAVGNVVIKANPVQDMALGGQMYWRDLARQLAEVWWKCHNIGASLQHGDIDTDVSFSVVCEQHGGQVFHADTPQNAWLKAEKWIMSPDRENFPSTTLQPA